MIAAGIGCKRGCAPDAIVKLVRYVEARIGRPVDRLAAPDFKRDEPGLCGAAAALGVRLELLSDAALAAEQERCPSHSASAKRATGFASIAEAAALACVGPAGRLIVPRTIGAGATCALAEVDGR